MTCPTCEHKTAATKAFDQEWCPNCGTLITLKDGGTGSTAGTQRIQVPNVMLPSPPDILEQLHQTRELEIGGVRYRVEPIE